MLTLDTIGHFTWSYNHIFYIETDEGNYEWSDPDYNGDNTIHKFDGNYKMWLKKHGLPYGRDKGTHTIRGYCGENVKIIL